MRNAGACTMPGLHSIRRTWEPRENARQAGKNGPGAACAFLLPAGRAAVLPGMPLEFPARLAVPTLRRSLLQALPPVWIERVH